MSLRYLKPSIKIMKTLIIDGNNLIHRTWWTAKTQSERYGKDNATDLHIYFTINAIYSYVLKYKPTSTIVVWDEKLDYQVNARKEQFKDYKGNRPKDSTPYQSNDTIKELLSYLGIPSIFPRELEADDIVAYICQNYGGSKVIVSVDQDFLQLVNDDTLLFDPIRKREYTTRNFEELTGYTRDTWLTAKCLQGDKSDNVPGVKGFGKVTIQKYLNGEITLTTEQQDICDINRSLFSLEKVNEHVNELEYYSTQLQVTPTPDWLSFRTACVDREFDRILSREQTWYSLFFSSHRLQSLLE